MQLTATRVPAHELVRRAAERGVLLNATSKSTLRAVTHLDISLQGVVRAGELLRELA